MDLFKVHQHTYISRAWQQDAGGDALQDPAQSLPWTEWASSAADDLLHQQLHRLEEETHRKSETQRELSLTGFKLPH